MNYNKDKYLEKLEDKFNEPFFKEIEDIIYKELGYNIDMLRFKSNSSGYVFPRMIFSYLCRKKGLTLTSIGRRLNRDHSTISNYLKNFDIYYENDKIFKILVNTIIKNKQDGK